MTSVSVTEVSNTVTVTENGAIVVVPVPETSVVVATTQGPQGPQGAAGPKSITIAEPLSGDEFTLFHTQEAITLTEVRAVVRGTNPSVSYELYYDADRTAAGTLATISDTVTNTTTGDTATVQNQPIPAGRYVWIEITAVTGTVSEFNLFVAF